jgi:holliday junction DNA helicase RuvA
MIGYLSGTVIKTRGRKLLLDVHSVGYEVFVSSKILINAKVNDEQKLWIHTHQTSDAISLFGFSEEAELSFFELLNSVNGVGPKTALDILETPIAALEKTISQGDAGKLSETPGIGKKTAARIVLELKPKIAGGDPEVPETDDVDSEILEAIVRLGYPKKDAQKILTKLPKNIQETEEIVRWFLQNA